jgi:hypothetical protein
MLKVKVIESLLLDEVPVTVIKYVWTVVDFDFAWS